ncbi:ribonuclease H2 complex subunit [Schizosaccharomyces japonicus yFS275]|uniref:Ribonuclease H2 complex subunit n=1 Tax=Schizosaccharomyces japonicus (strain yFS275 / FY16936) TaxID=402676 RepID=B6JZ60_SCHJY|nr:ribonuclease H2 complex subunit [Schizosaccharomyces japonicus yFS275]EEB06828.1 ribonuclease H2 complex subunit [Schizosaccharomyces japonicus yFS275]
MTVVTDKASRLLLKVEAKQQSAVHENVAHLLPCHIDFDGQAPVNEYFTVEQDEACKENAVAYLRGRELCGTELALPQGYQGYLVQSSSTKPEPDAMSTKREQGSDDEEEELVPTSLAASHIFDKVFYWEQDLQPQLSKDKWYRGIQEWTVFAEKLAD